MVNAKPRVAVMYLGSNGGGPKFAFELTRGLQANGYDTLAIVSDHADNVQDFRALGSTLALPTFRTMGGALLRSPLIPLNALRIRRQLRRGGAQALVIAMEHVWQAPVLAILRSAAVPQLLCVHDASMHPGDDNPVETVLLRLQRTLADGAIVFSEHVAHLLRASGEFNEDRIWKTVHGGYGLAAATPHAQPQEGEPPTIGFFGRIAEYKGLDICYQAVQILRAEGHRVRFGVIGNGSVELVKEMTDDDDDVRIGWVDDAAIPDILHGFSVLALPYTEASQSGVFAYAMTQGLPMVVTPVGGLVEQARQTGAATVAASLSPEDFARALWLVLSDNSLYLDLATNGLNSSRSEYSWERVAVDVRGALSALRGARSS